MNQDQIVYFHGVPGSPDELALVGAARADVFAPDRLVDRPYLSLTDYLDALAADIRARFPNGAIRLVGFSLGARMAVEVAVRLGDRIGRIDLIAPAAPLDLGDFLPGMEGRALFTAARDTPRLFPLMAWAQGRLAAWAPGRMFRVMFAHPRGEDAAMVEDPAFAAGVAAILRHSLLAGSAGYRREMTGYVRPWADILRKVAAPVGLWHGSEDNWASPAMSQALADALSGAEPLRVMEGLSHYSALREATREIFGTKP